MKKLLSIIFISVIVTSCAPSSEKSNTKEDLDNFLSEVEKEYKDSMFLYRRRYSSLS